MKKEREEKSSGIIKKEVPSSSARTPNALHFNPDLGGRNLRVGDARVIIIVVVVVMFLLFGFLPQEVLAHKPLEANDGKNNNFQGSLVIPDPKISWATYQSLDPASPALFYKFNARTSQELYVQLSIPQLDNLKDFMPKLALIGPNVSTSIVSTSRFADIVGNAADFPKPTDPHYGMINLSYKKQDGMPPQSFYEPFTQTSYWTRQEFRALIPSDGQYFLAVYVSDLDDLRGNSKFTLAVGEIEDFKPVDYFTTLPLAWIKTKMFFEDYLSVSAAILTPISIIAVLLAVRQAYRKN
jgi:hypothetical protein